MIAAPKKVVSPDTGQIPRIVIYTHKRFPMEMEPTDPANMIMRLFPGKAIRGPENMLISGHKFVRTDFRFRPGSLLSKFVTLDGDYLIEFDFRAADEEDLAKLADTMQTIKFQP